VALGHLHHLAGAETAWRFRMSIDLALTLIALLLSFWALTWARRAVAGPAEDVRSAVVAHRTLAEALAAAGEPAAARAAAEEAVRLAYATEQLSERPAADAVLRRLTPAATPRQGGPPHRGATDVDASKATLLPGQAAGRGAVQLPDAGVPSNP